MRPEKIVELINKVKVLQGEPPITLEEYQNLCNAETEDMKLYHAAQEGARRSRVRMDLMDKYPAVSAPNPLARCSFFLMKEEKTDADIKYNQEFIKKAQTREGVAEILEDVVKRIAQIPPEVYYPKDDAEMISNYEKYGDLMDTALTMQLMRADMHTMDLAFTPVVDRFLETHKGLFDILGMQGSKARLYGSPFYPALKDSFERDEKYTMILVAAGTNKADISPEQKEFNQFGIDSPIPKEYKNNHFKMAAGGQKLRESGQLVNHLYTTNNLYTFAEVASNKPIDRIKLDLADEKERKALDDALAGHFTLTVKERDVIGTEWVLNHGAYADTDAFNYDLADEKLIKLFGPEFEYAEDNLKAGVYTRENFKVSNYDLPFGCPFTESEAALIGLASMSDPRIGNLSRQDMAEGMRTQGNFSFCTENMISGVSRNGVGPLLRDSIDAARRNVNPLITEYMAGNKRPLAEALAGAVKINTDYFNSAISMHKNACYEGRLMNQTLGLLTADPEMLAIAKNEGLITDREIKIAQIGQKMTEYFDKRFELMEQFHKEVSEGRLPSDELRRDLTAKTLVLHFLSNERQLEDTEYKASPKYQAEYDKITRWFQGQANNPEASTVLTSKCNDLNMKIPVSKLMEKIALPGGMEKLESMMLDTKTAKDMLELQNEDLVKKLKYDSPNETLTGIVDKNMRDPLYVFGEMDDYKNTIVFDVPKPTGPVNRQGLKEDSILLSALNDGIVDAKKNVHMGSEEFDDVALDLQLLERANKELVSDPKLLTERNALALSKTYKKLAADCNKYLARKERQGKLDVDPQSKTGKRIKIVREALKLSGIGAEKYAVTRNFIQHSMEEKDLRAQADKLLYDSLTPETAGPLLKKLTSFARENSDPVRGQKIVDQMNIVGKYMRDKHVEGRQSGLTVQEYLDAQDVVQAHGVMKKPEVNEQVKKNDIPVV